MKKVTLFVLVLSTVCAVLLYADAQQALYVCEGTRTDGDVKAVIQRIDDQDSPRVTALKAAGPTAFALSYEDELSNDNVFIRVFSSVDLLTDDSSAPTLGANSFLGDDQNHPDIAEIPGMPIPTFVVSWVTEEAQDGDDDGTIGRVFAFVNGSIIPQSEEFVINTRTAGDQEDPHPYGVYPGIVLFEVTEIHLGREAGIRAFNATSHNAMFPSKYISSANPALPTADHQEPRGTAQFSNGSFVSVVWNANLVYKARVYNIDFATGAITDVVPLFQIHSTVLSSGSDADVAVLRDSSFIVTFEGNDKIYKRRFYMNGTPWTESDILVSEPSEDVDHPQVLATPDGGYLIGYDAGDIFVLRYDENDNLVGAKTTANNLEFGPPGQQSSVHMALLGDNNHVVFVWEDNNDFDGDDDGIVANTYCLYGPLSNVGRVATCDFHQCDLNSNSFSCMTGVDTWTTLVVEELPPSLTQRCREAGAPGNTELAVDGLQESSVPHLPITTTTVQEALAYANTTSLGISLRFTGGEGIFSSLSVRLVLFTYQYSDEPKGGSLHTGWTIYLRPSGHFVLSYRPTAQSFNGFRLRSAAPLSELSGDTTELVLRIWDGASFPTVLVNNATVTMITEYSQNPGPMDPETVLKPGVVYFGEPRVSACGVLDESNSGIVFYDDFGMQLFNHSEFYQHDFVAEDGI